MYFPRMSRKPYHVRRSKTGLGLFAAAPIENGASIAEYSGPRISSAEAQRRERRTGSRYMFEINSRVTIDGSGRGNIGRYANHACGRAPNAESTLAKGKIILRAIKNIRPGDEITYDYGREYVELFLKTNGGCKCAACVKKRGKKPTLRERAAAKPRRGRRW